MKCSGLHLTSSNELAARSLQKQLTICCSEPVADNSATYYTVRLTVGKGNWYCRFLKWQHISVRLAVSGSIRWKPTDDPNSTGFHSSLSPISTDRRVLRNDTSFYLIPNTAIQLAVAKREQFRTYALGGFLPDIPFLGSYDLHLKLVNQDNEWLPELTIPSYIENGEVKDEKNLGRKESR